ncbi:ABC transporter permease subunit [Natronobiforma cellulositropha]|uniref:ABC transporter permease subunit n=1 Tax=Natronobiforma cellulositropha TaxID=1679076 RepID=UPI0021D5ADF4|nr:urea ABC transporter permease [Natronobiforma cellulositropha]
MSGRPTTSVVGRVRGRLEGPNTMGNTNGFWIAFAFAVLVFAAYPVLFGASAANRIAMFLVFALLGVSLCFIWGYCGILSFGQVAFFGVAGYTFGIVTINVTNYTGMTLGIVTAIGVSTLFAAVLAYFMFYGGVRDVYVTIMTLVVAIVLHTFMQQTAGSEWAIGDARLGGFNGMVGIGNLGIGVGDVGITFDGVAFYYAALATVVAVYLGLRVLVNSRFGYAMIATREDEDRTEMFGYDTTFIKFVTFTIGGAIAGLSGVLFVTWGNYIDPSQFAITAAAMPVIWASIGGRESIIGTIAAAIAIQTLEFQFHDQWALVIVGSTLVLVIVLLPNGIAPAVRDVLVEHRRPASPAPSEEVGD